MPSYVLDIEARATDNASGALGNIDQSATKLSGSLSSLGSIASGAALGGVVALGGALTATAVQAFNLAGDVDQATGKMQAQLRLSADEAENFEETMRAVFRNNFGESFDDIGAALSVVDQQFQRIGGIDNQAQLQRITEQAFSIRDAFDQDVNESVGAAVTLMENFGLTGDEAMNFITAGLQRGLNSSGDFLDTITEYSNQFGSAGADAGEFFSILETGLAGGVLGTDKVADAFKEFNVRILDDSKTTREALADIGISYDELTQGFTDGSLTQIDAMQLVIEKIFEIEDPVQRNIVGVGLFGTQWEDLTESVIRNVDTQKTQLGDLEGAVDSLGAQYDNNAATWETATRLWQDALIDVGGEMQLLGAEVLPWISNQMQTHIVPVVEHLTQLARNTRTGEGIGLNPIRNWQMVIEEAIGWEPAENDPAFRIGRGSTGLPQQDLSVINPANRPGLPSLDPIGPQIAPSEQSGVTFRASPGGALDPLTGRPPGWVGAYTPPPGLNATINIYGNANEDDVRRGIVDGARSIGVTP